MKIVFCVEYDGTNYSGWQRQAGQERTIQAQLESAISSVANETVTVHCAGRTDAGVHATAQIMHFETTAERSSRSWLFGVNTNLPRDITVRWSHVVDDAFHARYSAIFRKYRYVIDNQWLRPALNRNRVSWIYRPLDEMSMQNAAQTLIGEHDFTSFRTVNCQAKSPVREITRLTVSRQSSFVVIDIQANAFLHHMVRNIAGVLIAIGAGEKPVHWCQEVLDARDRTRAGVTAPANGLYLTGVGYPEHFSLPEHEEAQIILS
jgi:tRNA pseudouridine38-40 synthase